MMKDNRTFMRAPVLVAVIVVILLLVAGTYVVIASPTLSVGPSPDLHSAPSGTVIWSSSWMTINQGQVLPFNHYLGGNPDNYAVELWFLDMDGGLGINRRSYGGVVSGTQWYGAHWQHLTANTIEVYRQPDDNAADQIRIQVWVAPTPDYDSGWRNIGQGETLTLPHGLGITATDLTVGLWFSSTALGVHHYAYGGLSVSPLSGTLGAFWHNLTDNTIQVSRFVSDTVVEQVRVVVVHGDPPDYDSDWQGVVTGTTVFSHNLNWDPDLLLVRGECYSPAAGGLGIHQQFAGGNHHWSGLWLGTNLQNLTRNTVTLLRYRNDETCPQARVRIWRRGPRVYLPLVQNNYGP